jgi:hypothetical protein
MRLYIIHLASRSSAGEVFTDICDDPTAVPVLYISFLDGWDVHKCVYHQDLDVVEYQFDAQIFDVYNGGTIRRHFDMTEVIFATEGELYDVPLGLVKEQGAVTYENSDIAKQILGREFTEDLDKRILKSFGCETVCFPIPRRHPPLPNLTWDTNEHMEHEFTINTDACQLTNSIYVTVSRNRRPLMSSLIERFRSGS